MYHAKSPYKYAKAYGSTYTTLNAALEACEKDKACLGFNYNGSKFQKTKSTTATAAVGYVAYKKGGHFVTSQGYMWDQQKNTKLTGYYDKVTYTSDSKAFKVCAGSTSCKGITKEGTKKYRANSSANGKTKKGMTAYVQGSPYVLYNKYYFTEKDGYTLSGYASTKKYTTKSKAMAACLTSSKCNGVTKEGTKNYRTNTGYTISQYSTRTAYLKGGAKINFQSYKSTYAGYSWTFKFPHTLKGYADKKVYKTRKAALTACAANTKCLGVTKEKAKTFRLNSSSSVLKNKDRSVWIKGGKVVKASGVNWSKKSKTKLSGYYNKTTYKTLAKALKACSKASGCKGVTKEASEKYRLNSSTTSKTNSASTAYKKGSTLKISNDYYWTKVSGYKYKTNLEKKNYKTESAALAACASKASTCSGVSYTGKGKYYLGKGDTKTATTGAKVFVLGSNYKSSFTYVHANSKKSKLFQDI